ncbi:hypothetical protein SVEN_3105 [Streptomyces venezuelae ATCC 10712]|uniref:Uncharacterized protein n=1 Tax=Streptomyces venezuelae (strain ATCC 10712 / CBS 650.69 / DSM 40230 / JCM 4526 / NBRC 13096 / PD 04745) TaxID=953739 RepID=F2R8T1_STRVP|nr:hypothetical protein SVEN_3105 [Streptomyces venezuelae ATCC 10712]
MFCEVGTRVLVRARARGRVGFAPTGVPAAGGRGSRVPE